MEENISVSPVTISVKKHVVVYGKHDYIVSNVEALLNKSDYSSIGFTMLAETLDYIRMNPLDAVLIGGGVDPHDRERIRELINADFGHVKVIEHFGGPATILHEIRAVLGA